MPLKDSLLLKLLRYKTEIGLLYALIPITEFSIFLANELFSQSGSHVPPLLVARASYDV